MIARTAVSRWTLLITAVIALIFQVVPLPSWLSIARPAFLVLVVLYWSIAEPRAGGIGFAFLAGLALDVFRGSVLGENALAMSFVAYLAIRLHLLLRNKTVFEQSMFVLAALAVYEFVLWCVDGWSGQPIASPLRWVHPLTGAILWPLVAGVLSRTHRSL